MAHSLTREDWELRLSEIQEEKRNIDAEFAGARFNVVFNGKSLFVVEDATFPEAGMVGLWTKADSVTVFSGFTYGERR